MIKKAVLVDGCFDPLHDGHIAYFKEASMLGDHLVVNLANDDEIINKRPNIGYFLPFEVRKKVLLSIRYIDEVVSFDTKEALATLNINIYVKGIDWKNKLPFDEVAICLNKGIEIVYLDTSLNSSSKLLGDFLKKIKL